MSSPVSKSQVDLENANIFHTFLENPKTEKVFYLSHRCNYKASQYPRVYLSSTLVEKISQANKYKNLSNTPKTKKRLKIQSLLPTKLKHKVKLFGLESVNPRFLSKFSHQAGCVCCKIKSLSCEAEFEKLIEETKVKTSLAKMDFYRSCDSRDKETMRDRKKLIMSARKRNSVSFQRSTN